MQLTLMGFMGPSWSLGPILQLYMGTLYLWRGGVRPFLAPYFGHCFYLLPHASVTVWLMSVDSVSCTESADKARVTVVTTQQDPTSRSSRVQRVTSPADTRPQPQQNT